MKDFQIDSDGKTVWVNGPDGSCLGRFGALGVDIHRTMEDQLSGKGQCMLCTHGSTGDAEWDLFVAGMKHHHGIAVSPRHKPARLTSAIS